MKLRYTLTAVFLLFTVITLYSQEKKLKTKAKDRIIHKNDRTQTPMQIQGLDTSVAQVETAIPAFIGYTEKGPKTPTKINSLAAYQRLFGGPSNIEIGDFEIDQNGKVVFKDLSNMPKYKMYYMLEMFFANGGEECFIVSSGHYHSGSIENSEMLRGLNLLNQEDLPTLILFPDAINDNNAENPSELYKAALAQCAERNDRFLICDVELVENNVTKSAESFRNAIGSQNLSYGAAYFPYLETTLKYTYSEDKIRINFKTNNDLSAASKNVMVLRHADKTIAVNPKKAQESLYHVQNGKYRTQYQEIKKRINSINLILPPSAAVAGVYTQVDKNRGVWKAPANVALNKVEAALIDINNHQQDDLNVPSSGKSINSIRNFDGRGTMVWGARTLAGNDQEDQYIAVNRFRMMISNSLQNAMQRFHNQPNNLNTWTAVKTLTEDYLTELWQAGAFQGMRANEAFFVQIGLGQTMTEQDIQDGKMILMLGVSPLRPAQFHVLKITQNIE